MIDFTRRNILLNDEEIIKISNAKVAVFGLGGVGGYTVESLARIGIKYFVLVDGDKYEESNLNRQLLSTRKTIGKFKTDVWESHLNDIDCDINVSTFNLFYNKDNAHVIDFSNIDLIIDAIDDVDAKVLLISKAKELNIPIVSMMGAGNRRESSFIITDIYKTNSDPLAKKMRQKLRENNIDHLTVVSSTIPPIRTGSLTIGSISYVVGSAGLKLAEAAINKLFN